MEPTTALALGVIAIVGGYGLRCVRKRGLLRLRGSDRGLLRPRVESFDRMGVRPRGGGLGGVRPREGEDPALADRLDDRLGATHSEARTHLERPPRIRRLAVVDRRDGEPVYRPVVRVDLGTTDAPRPAMAVEFVAGVLEAIVPELETVHVDRYDVELTFGPDGLLVDGERRRLSVPPELATRLVEEPRYRAHDLRRDLEAADVDRT